VPGSRPAGPFLEGTAASGGYLVPDGQNGPISSRTFDRGLARESAVLSMPGLRRQVVNGKREKYTEYVGRPAVSTVAEGADKPATGAELAEVTLDIVKAAGIVMLTEELIEDAGGGAARPDRHGHPCRVRGLGRLERARPHVRGHDRRARSTRSCRRRRRPSSSARPATRSRRRVERDGDVEANGYSRPGIIAANDVGSTSATRATALDATKPVYYDGFSDERRAIPNDVRAAGSAHHEPADVRGTAAAGRVVAVVGDFTQALFAVRNEVRRKVSTDATVDVSGTDHRLWQQNKLGVLWEMRAGFVVHDLNRAFAAVINAA
jgi:hypothetical protein